MCLPVNLFLNFYCLKRNFLVYAHGKSGVPRAYGEGYQLAYVMLCDFHTIGMSGSLTEIMRMQFSCEKELGDPNVKVYLFYKHVY